MSSVYLSCQAIKCLSPLLRREQQMILKMFQTDIQKFISDFDPKGVFNPNISVNDSDSQKKRQSKKSLIHNGCEEPSQTDTYSHNHPEGLAIRPFRFPSPALGHCCWDTGEPPPTYT